MRHFYSILLAAGFLMLATGCATKGYNERHPFWVWSTDLPKPFYTKKPAANRDIAAVDKFFMFDAGPMSTEKLLAYFGRPDGFSPQYIYSDKRSSDVTTLKGGTLLFLLEDKGEFHVWMPNYSEVGVAIAHPRLGRDYVLFNRGLRHIAAPVGVNSPDITPNVILNDDQMSRQYSRQGRY